MADKSGKEIKDNLQEANKFARNLKEEFLALDGISDVTKRKMAKMTDSLRMQADIGDQLNALIQERQAFIEEEVKNGRIISDKALEILDTEIKLLEKKKEQRDLQEELKDVGKDFAKDMGSALGISGGLVDAFMKLSVAAIGLAILKEVVGYITDSVGRIKELRGEFGTTAGQAMELNSELSAAKFSLEGMILGGDKLEAGMKAIVSETGNFRLATSEMITNVAELSEMMDSDMAVSLSRSLKNAGHDTAELTEYARELSAELGVSGAEGMKYLASNQLELTGLTKKQLQERIKEGMQLKKMGADMEHLNSLAGEALDLESSLRNEMKLRTMVGKDISFNELRAAQASGDRAAIAAAEKKLIDELGPSLEGNLQVQRMISEATGLSKEQMLNYKNATAEAGSEAEALAGSAEETGGFMSSLSGFGMDFLKIIGLLVGGMFALWGVSKLFKLVSGGKNPLADFIDDFGTGEVLRGAAAMLLIAASMFVMAKAISAMPTEVGPYVGMAVGLGLMLGALYLLAKFPTADLIKGALALVLVGVSLIPFAYAMSLIAGIEIGAILAVAAGIAIFAAEIMLLGLIMFSGIGALIFGAGILALLALGAAMIVLGSGIVIFNKGVSGLGDNITIFAEKMWELIQLAPLLGMAALPLAIFGLAMIPFAFGLAIATLPMMAFGLAMIPFVAGITALSATLPMFVESITQLGEQVPNLIAVAGGFGLFATSLMLASMAMLPFLPIFTITTLSMLALVPAMLIGSAGIGIWSLSLSTLSDSIARLMPNLTAFLGTMPMMAAMVMLVPGLIALSASFFILSGSLMALTLGLAAIALMLPVLAALGVLLPTVSAVFNGDGGDSAKESSEGGGVSMKEVVEEIRGLRKDIQSQPIMITVDGRVVSEITKVQNRKNSTRNTGYGG